VIIGNYNFTDPVKITFADYIEVPAVYVVMTPAADRWHLLYVGQTKDVSERFGNHEKWNSWLRNQNYGGLYVSILSVRGKNDRLSIETNLRNKFPGLPCNKQ
jgi:predicted GIY-YIG superfamily endonuclease